MPGSTINNYELFKAALGNRSYLDEINSDAANQEQFIADLETSQYTYQQILESIHDVADPKVRSLLITFLLSQPQYVDGLKGESLLKRLSYQESHIPSRLNPLVHLLDLQTLTTAMIEELEPEVAVSILCSIPHFSQLKNEQLKALIKKYQKVGLVVYWVNHFSAMPNAHYILAQFIGLFDKPTIATLNKLEPQKKEFVIANILEHLDVFSHVIPKLLDIAYQESHLILAIRLYLNGHYDIAYSTYIIELTNKLLTKNHSFSLEATQLLFCLNDKLAFDELKPKIANLTNNYLRHYAHEGNIALFYEGAKPNTQRMAQNIILPQQSALLKSSSAPTEALIQLEQTAENPIVHKLGSLKKQISYFDYFLMHYNGDDAPISKLLHDYLGFYARPENIKHRNNKIHHLSFMLTKPEISMHVKEAIFTAFTKYPVLHDEQVSTHLCLFDATRIIQHYGLKSGPTNYQHVINLCTHALKKLNKEQHQEIIVIAQKAQEEAQLELEFSRKPGVFFGLFKHIRRCMAYGWTGFFSPNSPFYVSPYYNNDEELNELNEEDDTQFEDVEADLDSLVNEVTLPLSERQLDILLNALKSYSLHPTIDSEYETRLKLHHIFHKIVFTCEQNKSLHQQLIENQNVVVLNQFRLLELILKENALNEAESLIEEMIEDSSQLEYIANELNCVLPEYEAAEEYTVQTVINNLELTKVLETTMEATTTIVAETTDYARQATDYAIQTTTELARKAKGWAEGWVGFFSTAEAEAEAETVQPESVISERNELNTIDARGAQPLS